MLGVARADDVWRAVKRHGDAYPGALTIYTFGRLKAARRDELREFVREPNGQRRSETAWTAAARRCVRRYGGSRDSEYERNG